MIKHTTRCLENWHRYDVARREAIEKFPNHCLKCAGAGYFDTVECYQTINGTIFHDYTVTCTCVESGICPKCGNANCSDCDHKKDSGPLYKKPDDCYCELRDLNENWNEQSNFSIITEKARISGGMVGHGDNSIDKLLESRHTEMIEWFEPWQACGPDGNRVDAHITLRASVHDCINLQRECDRQKGEVATDDAERLKDFISVHWASVVGSRNET